MKLLRLGCSALLHIVFLWFYITVWRNMLLHLFLVLEICKEATCSACSYILDNLIIITGNLIMILI